MIILKKIKIVARITNTLTILKNNNMFHITDQIEVYEYRCKWDMTPVRSSLKLHRKPPNE